MAKTDLDWLCQDASPEEVKHLMRLVHEWSQGDEQSFPVQLALLTRAQWRAAATIPKQVNESRALMELKLTEYRQQTATLVQNFSATADAKAEALAAIVATQTESMNQAVAKVQTKLSNAEKVASFIREELERGTAVWKKARANFEVETQKLEQARRELDARITRRDWVYVALVLLGMIALGVVIGLYIPR